MAFEMPGPIVTTPSSLLIIWLFRASEELCSYGRPSLWMVLRSTWCLWMPSRCWPFEERKGLPLALVWSW